MNEPGRTPSGNSETILLVDDEQAIVEPLRYHLEREGYAVIVESNNWWQAVELAIQEQKA